MRELLAASQATLAAHEATIAARDTKIEQLRGRVCYREAELEKLKFELARLKRLRFGRTSEKLDGQIEQLDLLIEELETPAPGASPIATGDTPRRGPVRAALPAHLPRESVVHEPGRVCPDCGGVCALSAKTSPRFWNTCPSTGRWLAMCGPSACVMPATAWCRRSRSRGPIAKSYAGPGLLAHVLVSKYADHLPLYRQARIYGRDGVELDVSTLADRVGQVAALVRPLVEAIGTHVVAGSKLHADDTPVPVLDLGRGRTKTGRLWAYVRDDRNSDNDTPPAVRFCYTPDRKGERPRQHLKSFAGTLQADGYGGFHHLYDSGTIHEAACWAHARRKFFECHQAMDSPIATDILERIQTLYVLEAEIRGQPAERRRASSEPMLDGRDQLRPVTLAGAHTLLR